MTSSGLKFLAAHQLTNLLPASASEAFIENISNLPEGGYLILENGNVTTKFVHWHHNRAQKPIGLIEINLNQAMCKQWLTYIEAQQKLPTYHYKVVWKAPRSYWRYLCVPYTEWSEKMIKSVYITSNEVQLDFDMPITLRQANGQVVYAFVSSKKIPLKDKYPFSFQLRATKDEMAKDDYLLTLPMAQPRHTYRTKQADYITDIVVKI